VRIALGGRFFKKFPAKFPASREFEVETRSIRATSTTTQSRATGEFLAACEIRRIGGVVRERPARRLVANLAETSIESKSLVIKFAFSTINTRRPRMNERQLQASAVKFKASLGRRKAPTAVLDAHGGKQ
jgi:hypothetical protein